jgi:hypothetical protein
MEKRKRERERVFKAVTEKKSLKYVLESRFPEFEGN